MTIKNFILKNVGLRTVALALAIFVWAMISGKERSYSNKTVDVNVEYYGIQKNIDVRSVRPDRVRIKVRATTQELNKITDEDFKLRIDLKDISEGSHNYWTENYLQFPEGMEIVSIQQKMIEVTVKEFITREVPTRVRYRGRFKPWIRLVERHWQPEKVKVFGYKSQIENLQEVEAAEWVNLWDIEASTVIKLPLKREKEILKFEDTDTVEVYITVENINKPQGGNDGKAKAGNEE
jgi:YbbR domain-containing protein